MKISNLAKLTVALIRGRSPGIPDSEGRVVIGHGMKISGLELSDEEARVRVAPVVKAKPSGAREALEFLADRRDEYLTDRAYRLIVAAMNGQSVINVDIDKQDLFSREAVLGRLPINDAFAHITELSPDLDYLREKVESDPATYGPVMLKDIAEIVGPRAKRTDSLVRSRVAIGVTIEYLTILSGDARRGDINTCYFTINARPTGALRRS
jgi:hypothetical protein